MGVWKARILSSEKRAEPDNLRVQIVTHLNRGWKIKGYSVDDKFHFALLVKETKEDND